MFVYVQGDLVVVVAVTPIVKLVIVSTSPTKDGWDFAPSVLLLHICLFWHAKFRFQRLQVFFNCLALVLSNNTIFV